MFEIGSTLREARVRRKLTLQQVAEDTKIRVKYLQALENEDFDLIPAPAYVKGFLRTYATYLGIDPQIILDEYRLRFVPGVEIDPFAGASALGKMRRRRRHSSLAFIAVAAILVLALLYILGVGQGSQSPNPPTPAVGILTSTSPTATTATSSSSASVTPSPSTSPFSGTLLRVSAVNGPCWVEARLNNAAGTVVYMGTLAQGQTKVLRAKGALFVRLGDPSVVRITLGHGSPQTLTDVVPSNYLVTATRIVRQ